ncbi:MAG: hypothetical protein AB8B63_14515 [Granulosicoccus sp.]
MRLIYQCLILLLATVSTISVCLADNDDSPGVLDRPIAPVPGAPGDVPVPATLQISESALEELVEAEVEALEKLPESKLQEKAAQGERAAQAVLADDFAEEAQTLSFAPAAANDALSDAVRWYATAAMSGFPGAPSLDKAGLPALPIRAYRSRP